DLTSHELDGATLVEALSAEGRLADIRTLGFYSHVDVRARERATEAGLDVIVPRSRMAREGPELVARLVASPPRAPAAGGGRGAATELGPPGRAGLERDEGPIRYSRGPSLPVPGARGEGGTNDHSVADDERGQLATFDVLERRGHPLLLMGEGLASGK